VDAIMHGPAAPGAGAEHVAEAGAAGAGFEARFATLFESHFSRIFRLLNRLTGEPDVAADLAQEAFIRLCNRRSMPDRPGAWLATVALNLFRNDRAKRARRLRLLTPSRGRDVHSDESIDPAGETDATRQRLRVRMALSSLPAREQSMLLLHAEGYRYRDIARATGLNEASVGTLLARARRRFREAWENPDDAP